MIESPAMKKEKRALLVIDMQLVAFDGKITPPISNGSQLLDTISTLIENCRKQHVPVIFAQTSAPSGHPYAKDMHGWEIHPSVTPRPDELIVNKAGPSGFEDPQLEKTLTDLGVTQLIVCGIWSEGCVSTTCRDALKRGFDICLAADGHSTVRENEDDANAIIAEQNEMLSGRGAAVIGTSDILNQLKAA